MNKCRTLFSHHRAFGFWLSHSSASCAGTWSGTTSASCRPSRSVSTPTPIPWNWSSTRIPARSSWWWSTAYFQSWSWWSSSTLSASLPSKCCGWYSSTSITSASSRRFNTSFCSSSWGWSSTWKIFLSLKWWVFYLPETCAWCCFLTRTSSICRRATWRLVSKYPKGLNANIGKGRASQQSSIQHFRSVSDVT